MSKKIQTGELEFYKIPSRFHTKNGPLIGRVANLALHDDGTYLVKLTEDYVIGEGKNKKKIKKGTLLVVNEDYQNLNMSSDNL